MEAEITQITAFTVAQQKVAHLLSLDKISPHDTADLNPLERRYFGERITEILADLQGAERDNF